MKSGSCEVNQDLIWELGERTVLVIDEPGMGKSSTTTQVAWCAKKHDPTSWVLRINWNDHSQKLQEIDAATFNLDKLVEFLCGAAFPESKYTDTNSSLLKQALQNSGNVTVLMDGFDEISPTYAEKALVVLKEIINSKVKRVWVTSRPVQRERIEKELSVTVFTLKKLSHEQQEKIFRDIWKKKGHGKNDKSVAYLENLLQQANKSFYNRNFTGCPLHIMMVASAFEEKSLKTGKNSRPDELNLLDVYETFIERKLGIYETEKKREDSTMASVQDDHEMFKEIYLENLEKCSLLVTLPSEINQLSDKEIQPTIQPFVERLRAGKDKRGVIMNVVDGKPQFVHRTVAEYFTAHWFSKNFESNRSVLERILFDRSYGIVKAVFDRILARDFPLHCAVIDKDRLAVEKLLQEGSDVNAADKGGRTAMHLAAAQGPGDLECTDITKILLKYKAKADTKDKVLDWTPLQYARQTGNTSVEQLLPG